RKLVYLNTLLKNNDGLLAQYIAKEQQITYAAAVEFINENTTLWHNAIEHKKAVELSGLGTILKNEEGVIEFEAYGIQYYLTASFGLSNIMVAKLQQPAQQETKVIPIETRKSGYRKYAQTAAAILVGVGAWLGYNNYQEYS